jgi:murein DD-endopeptidase MepM/ murein hydrolase activator NlpD
MDLSTDTSMVLFGIDGGLYFRSEAKAEKQGKTVTDIIEAYLASWLDQESPRAAALTDTRSTARGQNEPDLKQPGTDSATESAAGCSHRICLARKTARTQPSAPEGRSPEGSSHHATLSGEQTSTYVLRAGDTLAGLALKFYGDPYKYTLIAKANGITHPSQLYAGLVLCIPSKEEATKPPVDVPVSIPFRFPLNKIETPYFKFGSLYPSTSRWAGKPHPGVDFAEREGAPVHAIGEGRVIVNHYDPGGYGHFVMVEHRRLLSPDQAGQDPRVWSLYAHLQLDSSHTGGFMSPPVGQALRGQNIVIGREGKTGYSGGLSHVHFEVRKTPKLRLYSQINAHNLREHFWNPYTFIPANQFVPIADWPGLDG